ncbi:hypothetical protein PIB30_006218 [Stylosanthes scabra]|uniref:Uncharacterized protein n=1 Tax=Stylosanthes scabra TaxID=79078 RepID=A0ABU6Z3V8_9FABA|nr:hypothetical protein [Stylosanthes scabra]
MALEIWGYDRIGPRNSNRVEEGSPNKDLGTSERTALGNGLEDVPGGELISPLYTQSDPYYLGSESVRDRYRCNLISCEFGDQCYGPLFRSGGDWAVLTALDRRTGGRLGLGEPNIQNSCPRTWERAEEESPNKNLGTSERTAIGNDLEDVSGGELISPLYTQSDPYYLGSESVRDRYRCDLISCRFGDQCYGPFFRSGGDWAVLTVLDRCTGGRLGLGEPNIQNSCPQTWEVGESNLFEFR